MTEKTKYILTALLLTSLTSCFVFSIKTHTKKPKGDLKTITHRFYNIDKRVHVDNLEILKIDTLLWLLKEESLIGITVSGYIEKTDSIFLEYFDNVNFIEEVEGREFITNNFEKRVPGHINMNIIPNLRTTFIDGKPTKTKVKYKQLADKTLFEFYVEKKLIIPSLGAYTVDITCGQQKRTILLERRK